MTADLIGASALYSELSEAGFDNIRVETLGLDPPAVCVLATSLMAADAPPPVVLSHALGLVELGRSRAHRREGFLGRRAHQSLVLLVAPDLIGVLDAIGVEQADVVGLSYGGGTTQTATLRSPERFASMALLATTGHPFEAFQDRALSAETDGMEAQVVPSLTRWFTPAGLAIGAGGGFATPANERGGVRATIGRRPGAPSRASTSRTDSPAWRSGPWCSPTSSTPAAHRRSWPRSPSASRGPSRRSFRERRICRRSSAPSPWPKLSIDSCRPSDDQGIE